MKLKYTFDKVEIDNQITAVPVDTDSQFYGVLNVNKTGALILDLLKEETTIDKLVADILKEYAGDEQQIRDCVVCFVDELKRNDLIE